MTASSRERTPRKRIVAIAAFVAASALPVVAYDHMLRNYWARRSAEVLAARRPPTPAEIIDGFHTLSYNSRDTWPRNRWLGVRTEQNPEDVWVIQEIITEVKPDFVVEAGTLYGGSAGLWATILEQVNPAGRVITIDIADLVDHSKLPRITRRKVDFLHGSSTSPETVAEVQKRVKGRRTMVILDSDHHKAHVLAEIRAYAPMVPVGSYLIVQDSNINGHPVYKDFGPGPMEAIEKFLARDDHFVSDRSRERLLYHHHPKGYLRRIKG